MGDLGDTPLFYSARPSLTLDDREEPALATALLDLVVRETTAGLYACEASFGNWGTREGGVGFVYFDRETLELGRTLAVSLGEGEAAARVFRGRITALEADYPTGRPPAIRVLAEDRMQDLRMCRRTRSFEQTDDRSLFEQIARDHQLTPEVDVQGEAHDLIVQVNQSDLAFLRERARAIGAEVWVDGDTLHVQPRERRGAAEPTLTYGQRLRELSVRADLAHQRSRVAVGGWDPAGKEALDESADGSVLQPELPGSGGAATGPEVLESALGERPERLVAPLSLSAAEARQLAASALRQRARRFVTGIGEAEGDGRLRVGNQVTLAGLGPLFDGSYSLVETTHLFDLENGFRTRFRVERPWIGST